MPLEEPKNYRSRGPEGYGGCAALQMQNKPLGAFDPSGEDQKILQWKAAHPCEGVKNGRSGGISGVSQIAACEQFSRQRPSTRVSVCITERLLERRVFMSAGCSVKHNRAWRICLIVPKSVEKRGPISIPN